MRRFSWPLPVLLIASVGASACDGPTTPLPPPELPPTVVADLSPFDSIPSWFLLFDLSARVIGSSQVLAPPLPRASSLLATPSSGGLFGDSALGKSFVWRCDSEQYSPTNAIAGAPLDGIRVLLYGADDVGAPVCPLVTMAYYDIHDVGTAGSPALHITVRDTSLAVSYFDYGIQVTAADSDFSATLSGSVSDGVRHMDLAGTASGTLLSRVRSLVATRAGSPARVELHQTESDTGATGFTSVSDLSLIHGSDTVRFAGVWNGFVGHFTVDVNGRRFATILNGDSTAASGPDGRPLTGAEQDAVMWLGVMEELGTSLLPAMVQPAGYLLGFNAYHH
jgi:hypothetical protein